MGDDIVKLSNNKKRFFEKQNSLLRWKLDRRIKNKAIKQIDDEKRANLFMSRIEKQMKKQN